MPDSSRPAFATRAAHAASGSGDGARSLAPPIYLSTTFERDDEGQYSGGFEYSRPDNPNRQMLERALADLEGGVDAAAFASGMAATMTLFQALRPGDHVVVAEDAYYGVRQMLDEIFVPWGLAVSYADCGDLGAIEAVMRPSTRLLFFETPSNPTMRVTDIAGAASVAHAHGAIAVCDNTVATPVLQRPSSTGPTSSCMQPRRRSPGITMRWAAPWSPRATTRSGRPFASDKGCAARFRRRSRHG